MNHNELSVLVPPSPKTVYSVVEPQPPPRGTPKKNRSGRHKRYKFVPNPINRELAEAVDALLSAIQGLAAHSDPARLLRDWHRWPQVEGALRLLEKTGKTGEGESPPSVTESTDAPG